MKDNQFTRRETLQSAAAVPLFSWPNIFGPDASDIVVGESNELGDYAATDFDAFIATDNGEFYVSETTSWSFVGNLFDQSTTTKTGEPIRTRQATIPLTDIADGNTAVGLRQLVPSGKTLRILEVGVEDDTGSAPNGLTIEVEDLTSATAIVSENTRHAEGSPIASETGETDVAFQVANATGDAVNASGYVLYTME